MRTFFKENPMYSTVHLPIPAPQYQFHHPISTEFKQIYLIINIIIIKQFLFQKYQSYSIKINVHICSYMFIWFYSWLSLCLPFCIFLSISEMVQAGRALGDIVAVDGRVASYQREGVRRAGLVRSYAESFPHVWVCRAQVGILRHQVELNTRSCFRERIQGIAWHLFPVTQLEFLGHDIVWNLE